MYVLFDNMCVWFVLDEFEVDDLLSISVSNVFSKIFHDGNIWLDGVCVYDFIRWMKCMMEYSRNASGMLQNNYPDAGILQGCVRDTTGILHTKDFPNDGILQEYFRNTSRILVITWLCRSKNLVPIKWSCMHGWVPSPKWLLIIL